MQNPRIEHLEWLEDVDLAPLTTMGVRCVAKVVAIAHSDVALQSFLRAASANLWKWYLLGGGTNTVFSAEYYDGVILRLGREFAEVAHRPPESIEAGAAAPLSALVRKAADASLAGMEFCLGIPGQVGGALWGNAGQRGQSVCTFVEQVRGFTFAGEPVALTRGEFDYGYRRSALSGFVLTHARFVLKACDASDICNKMQEFLSVRKEQPVGVRSSGCIFKNPEGDSAGRLIDAAGLKGFSIGGAEVSPVHANFIINRDGASSHDIESLIDHVRATVKDRFGVDLQLEVRLVG